MWAHKWDSQLRIYKTYLHFTEIPASPAGALHVTVGGGQQLTSEEIEEVNEICEGEPSSQGSSALEGAALPSLEVPPVAGEWLVGLFCNRDMPEAVLGDLDEKFAELAERRGVGVAKAWYWGQAGRSVLFFAVRWGRRLIELEAILKRIL